MKVIKKKIKPEDFKPASEKLFRERIMNVAKQLGCEGDVQQIFDKYDRALKNCTNEQEAQAIGAAGCAEIHRLFTCPTALIVDGFEILPAEMGWENVDHDGIKVE